MLVCLALLALGPVTSATVAKTSAPRYGIGTVTLTGANAAGTATASCPKGTIAVSGGFSQSPAAELSPGHYVNVHDSHRVGSRSWSVSGVQLANQTSTLTAFAYCRPGKKPKQTTRSVPLGAAPRSEATAIASCPGNQSAISGGFTVPRLIGQTSTFLTNAEILGQRKWAVTGVRSSTSASSEGVVTSYAYCAKGAPPRRRTGTVSALSKILPVALSTANSPVCQKGTKPISGGLRAPYTQSGNNRGLTLITDAFLTGSAWRVSGLPFGGIDGIPVTLSSLAFCR
jgi:hypothetical protein